MWGIGLMMGTVRHMVVGGRGNVVRWGGMMGHGIGSMMVRHGRFHFHFSRFFVLHLLHVHHSIFVHRHHHVVFLFHHHHFIFVHHIVHWHFVVHWHDMIVNWWRRWFGRIGGSGYVMMGGFGGRCGDIVRVVSHVFDVRMVGIVIRIVRVICQYHNGQKDRADNQVASNLENKANLFFGKMTKGNEA